MQLRALFSEMDERKCVVLSVVGVGWCTGHVHDFGQEMLVLLLNVGCGVHRGCTEVTKRLAEFERWEVPM